MNHSSSEEHREKQNIYYFLGILALVIILELFFWWSCPVTATFGAIIIVFAIILTKRQAWTEKPSLGYGLIVIIGWAFVLGALEVYWFQNYSITYNLFYWFSSPVPYWIFMGFSGFFIVFLVSRSLPFSLVATVFYLPLEDYAFFIWSGIPPQNWFIYFSEYFPDWFIALGDPLPFWPFLPTFYILIWAVTIPIMILQLYRSRKKSSN